MPLYATDVAAAAAAAVVAGAAGFVPVAIAALWLEVAEVGDTGGSPAALVDAAPEPARRSSAARSAAVPSRCCCWLCCSATCAVTYGSSSAAETLPASAGSEAPPRAVGFIGRGCDVAPMPPRCEFSSRVDGLEPQAFCTRGGLFVALPVRAATAVPALYCRKPSAVERWLPEFVGAAPQVRLYPRAESGWFVAAPTRPAVAALRSKLAPAAVLGALVARLWDERISLLSVQTTNKKRLLRQNFENRHSSRRATHRGILELSGAGPGLEPNAGEGCLAEVFRCTVLVAVLDLAR